MAAPAGTPAVIVDKINADVYRKVLHAKGFQDSFIVPQSYQAGDLSRQQFAEMIRSQYDKSRASW